MAQGVLPFQYKEQGQASGLTALGGLPAYLDLAQAAGLRDAIRRHLSVRPAHGQGWNDEQIVMALILLNLSGGDCVADLERLEADEGLCQVMRRVEHYGLPRAQRRSLERRWRGAQRPSASLGTGQSGFCRDAGKDRRFGPRRAAGGGLRGIAAPKARRNGPE